MPNSLRTTRRYWQLQTRKVLLEGSKLNKTQWLALFRRLTADFADHASALDRIGMEDPSGFADRVDPRELLVWSWVALKAMPFIIAQDYARLRENGTGERTLHDMVEEAKRAKFVFSLLHEAVELQLTWTATLVRAADEALAGVSYWPEDPDDWTPCDWRPNGYECFVVPVRREYRLGNGKPRERRATYNHALIPTRIGHLNIDVRLHPGSAGVPTESPERMRYGAAVFEDLFLDIDLIGEDGFLLRDVPTLNWPNQVEQCVRAAISERVDVLAWPELTMPADRVAHLRTELRRHLFADNHRIPLISAGSWHVKVGDKHANRMDVLDRRGHILLTVNKRIKYPFKERAEAIVPGETVPLLVSKNRLVGFAICRDFCEDCEGNVFRELSADLVVLPSMGDMETVDAHLRHAKAVQSIEGSVVFAVQQHPTLPQDLPTVAPAGYSFARPAEKVDGEGVPSVEQREQFRVLQARL